MRPPRITAVEPLHDHWLRLEFTDGAVMEVDVGPLLDGPVFSRVIGDPEAFREVRVDREVGTVVWPGDVDLDPDVLYGRYAPDPPVEFDRRVVRGARGTAA